MKMHGAFFWMFQFAKGSKETHQGSEEAAE